MLLVSDRPLLIRDDFKRAGVPFEADPDYAASLLQRGVARHAVPPQVLYETHVPEQNENRLLDQGVTCLCITRNRRSWLTKAIACYLAQSYEARELLIVADGVDVRDLVPDREDIRLIHVEEGRRIGEKRNYGCGLARGKFIAHWDDDDYSAPDRLSEQVASLQNAGKAVAGYWSMHLTDGQRWWFFNFNGPEFAIGTSLLYERSWWAAHQFPLVQVGEDGAFMNEARAAGQLVTAPAEWEMIASVHPENTSPRSFAGNNFKPVPADISDECREWVRTAFRG